MKMLKESEKLPQAIKKWFSMNTGIRIHLTYIMLWASWNILKKELPWGLSSLFYKVSDNNNFLENKLSNQVNELSIAPSDKYTKLLWTTLI